mgnify:CR=1 FL=1
MMFSDFRWVASCASLLKWSMAMMNALCELEFGYPAPVPVVSCGFKQSRSPDVVLAVFNEIALVADAYSRIGVLGH